MLFHYVQFLKHFLKLDDIEMNTLFLCPEAQKNVDVLLKTLKDFDVVTKRLQRHGAIVCSVRAYFHTVLEFIRAYQIDGMPIPLF